MDAPLCLYRYDHLSNLGSFYRICYVVDPPLDFGMEVEDIFMKCVFTCFENGYGDNVILEESGLADRHLKQLLCSEERRHVCALDRIDAYLSRNKANLTNRFLEIMQGHPAEVRALCEEILQAADIPRAQRPKNKRETELLLAVINRELMDSVDEWAEDYLVRAGKLLVGDDLLQLGDRE